MQSFSRACVVGRGGGCERKREPKAKTWPLGLLILLWDKTDCGHLQDVFQH